MNNEDVCIRCKGGAELQRICLGCGEQQDYCQCEEE